MNIQETAKLLTQIQIVDNRQVGEVTILEWFELVGDLDFSFASEAVRMHFRESDDYLKPRHVRKGVTRIMRAGDADAEDEWGNAIDDPPALTAWQAVERKALGS